MVKGDQKQIKKEFKKTTKNSIKIALLTLFLFSLILITNMPQAQAQSSECCVVDEDGFCYDPEVEGLSEEDCTALGGIMQSASCSDILVCGYGCCCPNVGDPEIIMQGACTNTFHQGVTDINTCEQFCEQQLVKINGKVTYNNGDPADATVNFYSPGDQTTEIQRSTQTNENGEYSIYLPANREYKASANKNADDGTCFKENAFTITPTQSEQTAPDIRLPCTETTTCTMEYTWTWEDQAKACGNRIITVIDNGCNSGIPPKPNAYVPCLDDEEFECNPDGQLEEGEQCDPGTQGGTPIFATSDNTCAGYNSQYSTGSLGCTQQCLITTDDCSICPQTSAECTNLDYCACSVCQNANIDLCAYTCQPDTAELSLTAQRIYKKIETELNWDWLNAPNCQQQVQYYEIKRCDAEAGQCTNDQKTIKTNINTNKFTDADEYLKTDQEYCYNVTATISGIVGNFEIHSNLACVKTPNSECIDREEGEFCLNEQIHECTAEGELIPGDSCLESGKTCAGPDMNAEAYCVDVELCEACNGPFGLMGYTKLSIPQSLRLESHISACNEEYLERWNACYLDEGSLAESSIGHFKACSTITSCYDYMTKKSCEGNPCKAQLAEACDWNPLDEKGELGIGICVPQDQNLQDCRQCDEKSPVGTCTEQICSLFGTNETCHSNIQKWNFANDDATCINVEDVGCETYDTKEQCIGDGQSFTADIIHDNGVQGTHQITTTSQDLYGRGTCYWSANDGKCLKDADMSSRDSVSSDCSQDDLECLKDHEYPITNISLQEGEKYSITELINAHYEVTDNTYKQSNGDRNIETFFEITEGKPENIMRPYKKNIKEIQQRIKNPGIHTLFYYSKDKSNNYEPIKNVTFEIIKDISDLEDNITIDVDSAYMGNNGPDMFLSNLTITVNYPKELTCESKLTSDLQGTNNYSGDKTIKDKPIIYKYTQLTDGTYEITLNCKDDHSQIQTYKDIIIIEADTTIKEPIPRAQTLTPQNVTISLQTTDNAECYYRTDPTYQPPIEPFSTTINNEWTKFESTGNKIHEETKEYEQHKMNYYFTACRFDYTETNPSDFIGNWGDLIYFAIDSQPPQLEILDVNEGRAYQPTTPNSSVELEFKCTDKTEELRLSDENYMDFGCDSIYYCDYTENEGGCKPTIKIQGEQPWTQTFSARTGANKVYLNISVADKGGNTAIYDDVLLNLKNTTFLPPDIEILED